MSAEQRLLSETPQLVTLHNLLDQTLPAQGERTEVMRRHLLNHAVRPAMWRLLHQVGSDWMTQLRPYYLRERERRPLAAVDMLVIAQSFGTQELAPLWLLKAFLSQYGNPNQPRAAYHPHLNDLYGLNASLGRWAQNGRLAPLLQEHVHELLNWANGQWAKGQGNNLPRLTLSGLLRLVAEHQAREKFSAQNALPWPVGPGVELECHLADHEVVLVSTALQLWEEGQVMRHCAFRFLDECANGDFFVVSIRPRTGGRPLATVGLRRDRGLVYYDQVTGFANDPVSAKVRKEAWQLAGRLEEQLCQRTVNGTMIQTAQTDLS